MAIVSATASISGGTYVLSTGLAFLPGAATIAASVSLAPQALQLVQGAVIINGSVSTFLYMDPSFECDGTCTVAAVGASTAAASASLGGSVNFFARSKSASLVGGLTDSIGLDESATLDPLIKNGSVGLRLTA